VQILGDGDVNMLVAASGNDVYVTGAAPGDLRTTRMFHSADGGATWLTPVVLPARGSTSAAQARQLLATGADVYLARIEFARPSVVEVLASHDHGATFSPPLTIASISNGAYSVELGLTCDGYRALWTARAQNPNSEVETYIVTSHDGGATIGEPYWLGGNTE